MIKIPSETHQAIALQGFETFSKNQKRVLEYGSIMSENSSEADDYYVG
jgi:hypothetical protein